MEKEIWKDIEGFEGLYQVSNFGRVKSSPRRGAWKERILRPLNKKYLQVCLSKNNVNYWRNIHRLVAIAFIPNPDNLPQVNHIDGNKHNNRLDNLEWCTPEYNIWHEREVFGIVGGRKGKPVLCIETGKIYPSATDVLREFGVKNHSGLNELLNYRFYNGHKRYTWKGHHWRYL